MTAPDKPIVSIVREAVLSIRSNDPSEITEVVVAALRPLHLRMAEDVGTIIINGDLDDEGIREDLAALLNRWENYL